MSDGPVIATVNLSIVNRALVGIRNPDLRKVFQLARSPTRQDQRDHAKRKEGPDGSWAPRSPLTIARAQHAGRRRVRQLLGRLPSALIMAPSRRSLLVTSRAKWSRVHNDGGVAGHGAREPARTFLWISDRLLETVRGMVEAGLQIAWEKAIR